MFCCRDVVKFYLVRRERKGRGGGGGGGGGVEAK